MQAGLPVRGSEAVFATMLPSRTAMRKLRDDRLSFDCIHQLFGSQAHGQGAKGVKGIIKINHIAVFHGIHVQPD
ncbi:hypothetical protein [Lacrimispora indolis]|uniref:hypothetical protein n=1 Tax=Lacrimispora indolis TaxID=69825 RepID=UPI0004B466FC|nr:hypothetical protein [Lacrimispora indolis]